MTLRVEAKGEQSLVSDRKREEPMSEPSTEAGRGLLADWLAARLPAYLDEANVRGRILAIEAEATRDAEATAAELREALELLVAAAHIAYLRARHASDCAFYTGKGLCHCGIDALRGPLSAIYETHVLALATALTKP